MMSPLIKYSPITPKKHLTKLQWAKNVAVHNKIITPSISPFSSSPISKHLIFLYLLPSPPTPINHHLNNRNGHPIKPSSSTSIKKAISKHSAITYLPTYTISTPSSMNAKTNKHQSETKIHKCRSDMQLLRLMSVRRLLGWLWS